MKRSALAAMPALAVALGLAITPAAAGDYEDCFQLAKDDLKVAGCSALIAANPADAAAWRHRGIGWRGTREWQKSIDDLTRALQLEPKNADALSLRALSREELGDLDGAIADVTANLAVRMAAGARPSLLAVVHENRAGLYERQGRLDLALADLDEVVRLTPASASSWLQRAELHEKRGDKAGAIADYRKALAIDADLSSARDALKRLGAEG